MQEQNYPFTNFCTGKKIHTPEEEITEVYELSHLTPQNNIKIKTPYGFWIHGACPACGSPVDSWYMPYHCGYCGVFLNWKEIEKNFH